MKLYYAPGACSLAVHVALREAGLPFDLARVDLLRHRLSTGAPLSDVNPRNYVPVLDTDDGDRLTEVAAILQWIAEEVPEAGLLPAPGTRELRRAREWLTFVGTELHKGFSPWLWHADTAPSTREAVVAKLHSRIAVVEAHLEGRDWLLEEFSVADAYLFAILNWTGMLRFDVSAYPQVRAYLARVATRPAVRAALEAEGLVKAAAA